MHTVQYIDQLHHKLLHQIHSVGLPPQLIKGRYTIWHFYQKPIRIFVCDIKPRGAQSKYPDGRGYWTLSKWG